MDPITTYVASVKDLSAEEYARRHPDPFVVRSTLQAGGRPVDTGVFTVDRLVLDGNSQVGEDGAQVLKETYRVAVVRPREPGAKLVTLGCSQHRTDVLVSDPSVSKRHAVIIHADGGYRIRDNDSTAGTQLNGELIPEGEWRELSSGDRITLGLVDLIFILPSDFRQFVLRLF